MLDDDFCERSYKTRDGTVIKAGDRVYVIDVEANLPASGVVEYRETQEGYNLMRSERGLRFYVDCHRYDLRRA